MFNPPTIQAGEGACYGNADPIDKFGDTPDTEPLIEQPSIQKRLLRGEVPYQCKYCKTIFFVARWIIDNYSKAYQWGKLEEDKRPPKGLSCVKSHHVINETMYPPEITANLILGTAVVSPITIPIIGPLADAERPPNS